MHTTHSLQQIYVFTLCKMRASPESLGACGNEKKGSKTGWVSLWKGGRKINNFYVKITQINMKGFIAQISPKKQCV